MKNEASKKSESKRLEKPVQDRAMKSEKRESGKAETIGRRPNSMTRKILPLLLFLSSILHPLSSPAAPVVGSITDVGTAPINTAITFTPTNDIFLSEYVAVGPARTIYTTNPVTGSFSNVLAAGPYTVSFPLISWRRAFVIVVPPGTNVVQFTNTFAYPRYFIDGRSLQAQIDALRGTNYSLLYEEAGSPAGKLLLTP